MLISRVFCTPQNPPPAPPPNPPRPQPKAFGVLGRADASSSALAQAGGAHGGLRVVGAWSKGRHSRGSAHVLEGNGNQNGFDSLFPFLFFFLHGTFFSRGN